MKHHDICHSSCSLCPTRQELVRNHGTLLEFARTTLSGIAPNSSSYIEARAAVNQYAHDLGIAPDEKAA